MALTNHAYVGVAGALVDQTREVEGLVRQVEQVGNEVYWSRQIRFEFQQQQDRLLRLFNHFRCVDHVAFEDSLVERKVAVLVDFDCEDDGGDADELKGAVLNGGDFRQKQIHIVNCLHTSFVLKPIAFTPLNPRYTSRHLLQSSSSQAILTSRARSCCSGAASRTMIHFSI